MKDLNFDIFTLDFINIINYCKSILPNKLYFLYYSIIIFTLDISRHYAKREVKLRVIDVEPRLPVTSSSLEINEALGIPNLVLNNPSENPSNKPRNNPNSTKSILNTFINRKNHFIKNMTDTQNFMLPFILNILDINLPEGSENLTKYAFGVMTLSLVILLCFINILGYFLSLYILDKYNIENKFPKLNKI